MGRPEAGGAPVGKQLAFVSQKNCVCHSNKCCSEIRILPDWGDGSFDGTLGPFWAPRCLHRVETCREYMEGHAHQNGVFARFPVGMCKMMGATTHPYLSERGVRAPPPERFW